MHPAGEATPAFRGDRARQPASCSAVLLRPRPRAYTALLRVSRMLPWDVLDELRLINVPSIFGETDISAELATNQEAPRSRKTWRALTCQDKPGARHMSRKTWRAQEHMFFAHQHGQFSFCVEAANKSKNMILKSRILSSEGRFIVPAVLIE